MTNAQTTPRTITVVIPLYNKEAIIERAIASVLAQTHADLQLIIIDDGSTDRSPEIAAAVADPRITLVRQENAGPGAARNAGIRLAETDYVAFLDADDEWEPDHLATAFARLEANPGCAAHVCGYFIGPNRISRAPLNRQNGISPGPFLMPPRMGARQLKFLTDFFHSSCVVARRAVLVSYGGYFDDFRCLYAEDSFLWLQVLLNETTWLDPEPRVWFHTEYSDLGAKQFGAHPRRPALLHPERIETRLRPGQQRNLQRLLAWYRLYEEEILLGRATPEALAEIPALRQRFPYPGPFDARIVLKEIRNSLRRRSRKAVQG